MEDLYVKMKSWLEQNKESMISDTLQMLKINSESYDRAEVDKSLKEVLAIAQRMGFKTEIRANGEVGVVFLGEGSETLGILAHVDVVPFGDIDSWTHSPYGEQVDDKIYGRGIIDNKGMVIASLYAMAAVKAMNMPIYKKVELIIGTREEIVWDDLDLYKEEGHPMPDYGFTPDGEFPIMNREKGNCEILLTFKGEPCPGDFEILDIKSGEAVNSVPDKAYVKIKGDSCIVKNKVVEFNKAYAEEKLSVEQINADEIMVVATGKAAHSSLPQHGENAMTILCVFLWGLDINSTAVKGLVKFVKDNFNNNFYGDLLGLPRHQEELNGEELGRTTVVPSMTYLDEGIHLYLSIRSVYGTTRDEIIDTFNKLGQKYSFTYSMNEYLAPLYVSKDHKFIKILAEVYEKVTKEKADFILAGGTTYAKALPNSVAFGPVFPGDIDRAHQKDEFVTIDSFMKATEIYTLAVAEVILNKESLK